MGPLYIVTERFHPGGDAAEWEQYRRWSGLDLTELISLDPTLCPSVLQEISDEDWPHIVNQDFMLRYFTDLDHLVRRVGSLRDRNLLAVHRNPESEPTTPLSPGHQFVFEGYDLVGVDGGPSALSNCGGFPKAFANAELTPHGLLASLSRANEVRRTLRDRYPSEPHAICDVWAIHRAVMT
jgi:hypothetical protein